MINTDNQYFYLAIINQNLHINYFSSKDYNSSYQKKYLMPDTLGNNLNLVILTKFISEKIKDFEKDIGGFIEKVNLITDASYDQFSLSLKNKYDSEKIEETDVIRLISDAKQQILRNNKDCVILHLLVDRYIGDGEEFLDFPEDLNYKEFIILSISNYINFFNKSSNVLFKVFYFF